MAEDQCVAVVPHENHQWLMQFIGIWSLRSEARMAPDADPVVMTGAETVRSFGDFWILGEGWGEMPDGTTGNMLLTLGFDPALECLAVRGLGR